VTADILDIEADPISWSRGSLRYQRSAEAHRKQAERLSLRLSSRINAALHVLTPPIADVKKINDHAFFSRARGRPCTIITMECELLLFGTPVKTVAPGSNNPGKAGCFHGAVT
jgi:hypothetical protein